jgi:prepilin peptidase CpaA
MFNFLSSFSWHMLLPFYVYLLLSYTVITDVKFRRIPNWVCLQIFLCFAVYFIFIQDFEMGSEGFLSALIALAMLLPLFALKVMGGGDVKLISVASMWVGADQFILFLSLTALLGGLIALFYLIRFYVANCLLFVPIAGAKLSELVTRGPQSIPYAIAIVCAAQYLMFPLLGGVR